MRIAIMGVSGSGKTTLSQAIASQCSVPLLEEKLLHVIQAALHVDKCSAHRNREGLEEAVRIYYQETIKWLKERSDFQRSHDSFITDRCCFDALCAWMRLLNKAGAIKEDILLSLIRHCQNESKDYDLIVVLPVTDFAMRPECNEDGLQRSSGLATKLHQQAMILGCVYQFSKAPIVRIPGKLSTTQQRIEYVLNAYKAIEARREKLGQTEVDGSILG